MGYILLPRMSWNFQMFSSVTWEHWCPGVEGKMCKMVDMMSWSKVYPFSTCIVRHRFWIPPPLLLITVSVGHEWAGRSYFRVAFCGLWEITEGKLTKKSEWPIFKLSNYGLSNLMWKQEKLWIRWLWVFKQECTTWQESVWVYQETWSGFFESHQCSWA